MIRASVLAALAGALLGCSSSSTAKGGAGDASSSDAPADTTQPQDAGADAEAGPSGPDAAVDGACEPVKGACSLVLQNCGPGQQCTVNGSDMTACGPTDPAQHIAKGYPCCPPADAGAQDPCLPGLVCVGDTCVGDAGGGGRCVPYCCAGDDTPCGTSPEGFAGHCDETVVDNTTRVPLYEVCEYRPPCKPLGILPCPAGYACLVDDPSGGAKCTEIFNGGAPAAQEGQPCMYRNSCADGLMCLQRTFADGAGLQECVLLCYTGKGSPPFDAGALDGGPGSGGCDQGKTCTAAANLFPPWLGVCL